MICQRYSLKPSEVAKDDITDYQFNLLVASVAVNHEAKLKEKEMRKAGVRRG